MNNPLPPLIQALLHASCYPHPVAAIELIETHISWVILTGQFAYKIKKPLNLGFLDFSSLERRRRYCHEELRLNRRLAPQLYLDVVAIGGTPTAPTCGGAPPTIEYAVKMRQFPQEAQLDRLLARQALQAAHIDQIAGMMAAFHQRIARADTDSRHGSPANIQQPVMENFALMRKLITEPRDLDALGRLERWSTEAFSALTEALEERRRGGFVRECHGDMHLRNLALIDGDIVAFDCIEFNENLRWIDVMSELAFLIMDLEVRDQRPLARRLLDAYLQLTGDYGGLRVLRFYQVYRAMVRAKVAAIRLAQADLDAPARALGTDECRSYLALAAACSGTAQPRLIITHGLSGSGKTTITQNLLEATDAIRLRSDIERKRLFGRTATTRSDAGIDAGIYDADATERTYQHLASTARDILSAGCTVIVDAAFLQRSRREAFRRLAGQLGVPFAIIALHADPATLQARIVQRQQAGADASDADLAVLARQCQTVEAIAAQERGHTLVVDAQRAVDADALARQLTGR